MPTVDYIDESILNVLQLVATSRIEDNVLTVNMLAQLRESICAREVQSSLGI